MFALFKAPHREFDKTNIWVDQIAASLEAYFWPKFFFDFLTKNFDGVVKPVPILQTVNLVLGFLSLAYEWPLRAIAGTSIHRSIEFRLLYYPLACLFVVLLYQGTNAALYYIIGTGIYFWAYTEGEASAILPDLRSALANKQSRSFARRHGLFRGDLTER